MKDATSRAGNRRRPGEAMRVPRVYLLRCADDTLYCGWTTDVRRRLAAHLSGTASRYTRSRRPVELAGVIAVADRSAALREEARIKRLSRAAKLQLITTSLDTAYGRSLLAQCKSVVESAHRVRS